MAMHKGKPVYSILGLALMLLLSACTVAGKPSLGNKVQGDAARLPDRLLVLPVKVSISEVSAGGVAQEDPEWTRQGTDGLNAAIAEYFAADQTPTLVELPELTDTEAAQVYEHTLLYDVVASQAFIAVNVPSAGWGHLAENFHYTLGDGLRFLKQKSGADAALIVFGSDSFSTGGRKTMVVLAALMGVGLPTGSSRVLVGVVDLEDGDILWFRYIFAQGNLDLRKAEDAKTLFTRAMEGYGGE